MIGNLKALGLALVAMLAMGAVAASAASAQGVLTSDGPVTLVAEETGEPSENGLTAFGAAVRCPGSTYTGHEVETTPHALIPNGESEATLTPNYVNCTGPLGWPATVDMNGCDYVINLGGTDSANTYNVSFDVECPDEKEITVTLFRNATDHANGKSHCDIHVPEQTGLSGAHATDNGNGTVSLSGTVTGISATKSSTGAPLLCPHQSTSSATFDLNALAEGLNGLGESTSISLSH